MLSNTSLTRRSGVRRQLSAWMPVLFCVLVICAESTVMFGADHTSGPLQRFLEWVLGRRFTQPQWWWLHIRIRKGGHFLGYGLLSVAWFRAFWMTLHEPLIPISDRSRFRFKCHGLAMLGTFVVACNDELHQLYLPNRSGSFVDVMIDCSGALLLQLVISLWMLKRSSVRTA